MVRNPPIEALSLGLVLPLRSPIRLRPGRRRFIPGNLSRTLLPGRRGRCGRSSQRILRWSALPLHRPLEGLDSSVQFVTFGNQQGEDVFGGHGLLRVARRGQAVSADGKRALGERALSSRPAPDNKFMSAWTICACIGATGDSDEHSVNHPHSGVIRNPAVVKWTLHATWTYPNAAAVSATASTINESHITLFISFPPNNALRGRRSIQNKMHLGKRTRAYNRMAMSGSATRTAAPTTSFGILAG